jgi:hypothetical protein
MAGQRAIGLVITAYKGEFDYLALRLSGHSSMVALVAGLSSGHCMCVEPGRQSTLLQECNAVYCAEHPRNVCSARVEKERAATFSEIAAQIG